MILFLTLFQLDLFQLDLFPLDWCLYCSISNHRVPCHVTVGKNVNQWLNKSRQYEHTTLYTITYGTCLYAITRTTCTAKCKHQSVTTWLWPHECDCCEHTAQQIPGVVLPIDRTVLTRMWVHCTVDDGCDCSDSWKEHHTQYSGDYCIYHFVML